MQQNLGQNKWKNNEIKSSNLIYKEIYNERWGESKDLLQRITEIYSKNFCEMKMAYGLQSGQ